MKKRFQPGISGNENDEQRTEAVKRKYAEEGIVLKAVDIYRAGLDVLESEPVRIER